MRNFLIFLIFIGAVLISPWVYITYQTYSRVYQDIESVPAREF